MPGDPIEHLGGHVRHDNVCSQRLADTQAEISGPTTQIEQAAAGRHARPHMVREGLEIGF
jgi:hypothetical protein